MQATTTEATVLKLTVADDGQLWMLDGDGLPRPAEMTGEEFLRRPGRLSSEQVRVVGCAGNARLILRLYELRVRDEIGSVELCSPLVCQSAGERRDPERLLHAMRRWSMAGSLGGWHEMTRADFAAYAMSDAAARGDDASLVRFFRHHPVYRSATFPVVDELALARVAAVVIDPRWYVDPEAPDRPAKLFAFMGMDPSTHKNGRDPYLSRSRLVRAAWDATDEFNSVRARLFIRHFYDYHAASGAGDEWRAALRAGQQFLRYLRAVWLDALHPVAPRAERLFVPSIYFKKNGAQEMAFEAHMRPTP